MIRMTCLLSAALAVALAPVAQPANAADAVPAVKPVAKTQVEIYRIAPGEHENFLRFIARVDEVNRAVGLPARQLFVHRDGADWDFLILQPAELPADKAAAFDAAWDRMGMPSGGDFFIEIRKYIAEHSDTVTSGPTTAADFLATLKR